MHPDRNHVPKFRAARRDRRVLMDLNLRGDRKARGSASMRSETDDENVALEQQVAMQ